MSFLKTLFGLPEKLLLAIFAFGALFFVSVISSWFPGFGNWFWGVGLIVAAVFLQPIVIYKARRFDLTAGSIAALLGIGILVLNILAVNLPSFSFTVMQAVSRPAAQAVIPFGDASVSLDLTTVFVATAGSVIGAVASQAYILRKRRK